MVIGSDRVGSLGKISWWGGLRVAVRILIFTGYIKAWVVYLLYVYCTLQKKCSGEQYYGQDVPCTMSPTLGVWPQKGQLPLHRHVAQSDDITKSFSADRQSQKVKILLLLLFELLSYFYLFIYVL